MKKLQFANIKYILSKLGDIKIFHYLTVDEKWKLLSLCEVFEYNPEEKIISQGETGTCFYAILSGNVNVTVNDRNSGKDVFLASIWAGDFFGETGIFSNSKRTANVISANTTEILCIQRNNFFNFINTYAPAGVKILMIFVDGVMNKLNDSNKELAFERREVLDQSAIDQFLQSLVHTENGSEPK
jgi:CRP/FNR family transcriptional regulator, cyclic AMP receptor protein